MLNPNHLAHQLSKCHIKHTIESNQVIIPGDYFTLHIYNDNYFTIETENHQPVELNLPEQEFVLKVLSMMKASRTA